MNKKRLLTVMGSTQQYYQKLIKTIGASSIVELWNLDETSGTVIRGSLNSLNGTYSGATVNNTVTPKNNPSPLFDGSDYGAVFSAGVAASASGEEGSFLIWGQLASADVRTDSTWRNLFYFQASGTNLFDAYKRNNASLPGQISYRYTAGGTAKSATQSLPTYYPTDGICWFQVGITWSKAADRARFFYNGQQIGADQSSLGTWSGALNAGILGANSATPGQPWNGNLASAVLCKRELTPAEVDACYGLMVTTQRITVLGDSIPQNTTFGYPLMIKDMYNGAHVRLTNRAVSGATIITDADGDDDLDAQVVSAASDNANKIIIGIGVNDNNAGNMTTLQAEAEENIAELKASNPLATIYWMNVLPCWTDVGGGTEVDKSNIRTAIAAACTAQGITCWDTYTTPWIDAADTSDGLHPTAAGHAKIAAKVLALLP